jgi:hypothetical protein
MAATLVFLQAGCRRHAPSVSQVDETTIPGHRELKKDKNHPG